MWPEEFAGENLLRDWIAKAKHHPVNIVLVENNILISHTAVLWKLLEHAGEIYKVYGLNGVFTYPAFRRQGYGRRVVDAGTAYIKASDADIGMFHCDPDLKDFYAGSRWVPMEHSTTWIGAKDSPEVSDELMMALFLSEKGKKGRSSFESEPVFFGDYTW